MAIAVSLAVVQPMPLAAVRRVLLPSGIRSASGPALDQVRQFLRTEPSLQHVGGHSVFLYHHPERRGGPLEVDFGVEVAQGFEASGAVFATATPGGEVATAIHRGSDSQLHRTHSSLQIWVTAHGRVLAGTSWEIYGEQAEVGGEQETRVAYLLR